MKLQRKNLMLFDVDERNNLMSTRVTPVATLLNADVLAVDAARQ